MVIKKKLLGWGLAGLMSITAAQTALACAFHGYIPNPTLVDVLLRTEQVVVARLSSGNGWQYVPVETLMGFAVTEVPGTASRSMRKQLRGDPSATVLLARDGAYGPWFEVAVLDAGYRTMVDEVLKRQTPWMFGDISDRLAFFAKRVNDPNPDIRRLALRELDRVSYADLQRARLPKVQNLQRDLTSGEADLRPVRILLAGLSGDAAYVGPLQARMDQAFDDDTPYLGAYVTALIELQGKAAVEMIVQRYLLSGRASGQRTDKLMQALALQYKSAPRGTRRTIAREVAALSRHSADFAQATATYFGYERGGRFASP